MSKRILIGIAPVLAIAAFAMTSTAAQAAIPHWYSCEAKAKGKFKNSKCTEAAPPESFEWVRIKEGTKAKPNKVAVKTKGTLTLTNAAGLAIECKVKDAGSIWNPAGGGAGEDEITEFVNSECKSNTPECPEPEIIALGLPGTPWTSVLVAGPPIRDEINGIKIELKCGKVKVDEFFGHLSPEIGSSVATFGAGSGSLEDAAGNKATVTGTDSLEGPAGDVGITAKEP